MSAAPDQTKTRPPNTRFRQQNLHAVNPIMAPTYVSGCMAFLGILCISLGTAVAVANGDIIEVTHRYDHIHQCRASRNQGIYKPMPGYQQGCKTLVNFTLTADMPGPVYLYYKLTNFFQNHRRYALSRDNKQLDGTPVAAGAGSSTCDPVLTPGSFWDNTSIVVDSVSIDGKETKGLKYSDMQYSPCGLVAWSMFNDTVKVYRIEKDSGVAKEICDSAAFFANNSTPTKGGMECHKKGIAWESDSEVKFLRPGDLGAKIWTGNRAAYSTTNSAAAAADVKFSSTDTYINNGWYAFEPGHPVPVQTDEDLMVWMKTSSLPSFRKLFRIFREGLPKGDYQMTIHEFFDSQQYDGQKMFIFATSSWIGAKNTFLAATYLTVGSICLVLAVGFVVAERLTEERTSSGLSAVLSSRE